jgi:hypothetical protein
MALIRIEHDDFVLQVSCGAYDTLYAEAKRNISEDALWASYACSDQGEPLFLSTDDAKVRLFSIAWMPPVSMIVGKDGYLGEMANDDIINTFGDSPYDSGDKFHVWRGELTNCRLWEEKF